MPGPQPHNKRRVYAIKLELLAMADAAALIERAPALAEVVPMLRAAAEAIEAIDGSRESIMRAYFAVDALSRPLLEVFREARNAKRDDVIAWLEDK